MAHSHWCGQGRSEVAVPEWLVPIRVRDLTEAFRSRSNGRERGRGFLTGVLVGEWRSRAAAVAGDARRRCRGSGDTGEAWGGAARRGGHDGGRCARGGSPNQRRGAAAARCGSGVLGRAWRGRFAAGKDRASAQLVVRGHGECKRGNGVVRRWLTGPESEGRRWLGFQQRRAIPAAWRRDSSWKQRANEGGGLGFIAMESGQ